MQKDGIHVLKSSQHRKKAVSNDSEYCQKMEELGVIVQSGLTCGGMCKEDQVMQQQEKQSR